MMHKGQKVLIVDDTPENISIISNALSDKKKIAATNGIKAIELAVQHKPDLILLDIVMPGMDGFEVCQILKVILGQLFKQFHQFIFFPCGHRYPVIVFHHQVAAICFFEFGNGKQVYQKRFMHPEKSKLLEHIFKFL